MAPREPYGPLRWYDYFLFAMTLAISMGIGIYFAFAGRKKQTTNEYLRASRTLSFIPAALSIFMSRMSALLVIGSPAEAYEYGMITFFDIVWVTILGTISAIILIPPLYAMNMTSINQYMELRFNSKSVKYLGTFYLVVNQLLYAGLALFSPSVALETATGLPVWISMLSAGLVVTIYTTIGGIRGVVWTDVFQFVVFMGGMLIVLIMGSIEAGGASAVWKISGDTGRLNWFEWNPDPFIRINSWTILFTTFLGAISGGTDQTTFQRYTSTHGARQAIASYICMTPFWVMAYVLSMSTGLVIFAYYYQLGCDPLKTDQMRGANDVLLYFIMNVISIPAFPGLLLAVMYSGSISSISSSINSMAAVIWKDILEGRLDHLSESKRTIINKIIVCGFGILATGFSFMFVNFSANFLQLSNTILGGMIGPSIAMWWLAVMPCANWIGTLAGSLIAFALMTVTTFMNSKYNPYYSTLNTTTAECANFNWTLKDEGDIIEDDIFVLFRLSYRLYPPIGVALAMVLGLLISIFTARCSPPNKDPRYFISLTDRLCCCCPHSFLKFCWCGMPMDSFMDVQNEGTDDQNPPEVYRHIEEESSFHNPGFDHDDIEKERTVDDKEKNTVYDKDHVD